MQGNSMMKTAVLLGLFDGVHRGHAAALEALRDACVAGKRLVYTFPSASLDTKGQRKLLLTDDEKRQKLLSMGADEVVFADFESVRNMTAQEFAEKVLKDRLGADCVICGENFRFGAGASADTRDLQRILGGMGIRFVCVPIVYFGGEPISTTRIRALIEDKKIKEANSLLGYGYTLCGKVVHGNSLGRKMGIRTINTLYPPEKLLPPNGVYSSSVVIQKRVYKGVTDIGTKPTVSDDGNEGIETHILDYDGDLYGKTVSIIFNDYYREEKKFSSQAELVEVISADIQRRKEES